MATGLSLPLKTEKGRLKKLSGTDYNKQLVMIAAGDGDSMNAFQDLCIGEFMIFGMSTPGIESRIQERAERAFEPLDVSQLVRLDDLEFSTDGADKKMLIGYTDLETGIRDDIDVPIPEE